MKKDILVAIVVLSVWIGISYKLMLFPVCHYAGESSNACINNLRQIDGAKDQYMLESGRTNGPVDVAVINWYLKSDIHCESGGTYTYGNLGARPVCSVTNPVAGVKERVGILGWRWKVRPSRYPHKLPY